MGILGKEDSSLGLEIGADRVNACQLRRVGQRVYLVALGTERISEEPQPKEEMGVTDLTISAIQRLLKNNNIKAKKAYTSVSGDLVIVRYIKLPLMPKEELREVIRFQAEEYIPFNINEVILDFEPLKEVEAEGERKSEVLLVAVKKDVIRHHIEVLEAVGIMPLLIDVDTFAIEEVFKYKNEGRGGFVALVNIESRATSINILENEKSLFNRNIRVGENDFVRALANKLGLDFKEASQVLSKKGAIILKEKGEAEEESKTTTSLAEEMMEEVEKESEGESISSAIEGVLIALIDELARSLDYYYTQSLREPLSKIIISGKIASIPNLGKIISERLRVPVLVSNPFEKIEIDPVKFNKPLITNLAPLMTVSVGLALRGCFSK